MNKRDEAVQYVPCPYCTLELYGVLCLLLVGLHLVNVKSLEGLACYQCLPLLPVPTMISIP